MFAIKNTTVELRKQFHLQWHLKNKNKFNQKFQNRNFENYKTVLKRTLKMENISCSQILRINIDKIAGLTECFKRFNTQSLSESQLARL